MAFTEDDLRKKGLVETSPGIYARKVEYKDAKGGVILKATEYLPYEENEKIVKKYKGKTPHKQIQEEISNGKSSQFENLIFAWADKDISLNKFYSSPHWTMRNKKKNEWHTFFKKFLHKPYPIIEKYEVTLECNSRLDLSNCIMLVKFAEDMLQEEGIIKNDNQEFCKLIQLIHNPTMKRKSYKIIIKPI